MVYSTANWRTMMCTKLEPWSQVGPREQTPPMLSLDSYLPHAIEISPAWCLGQSVDMDFTIITAEICIPSKHQGLTREIP